MSLRLCHASIAKAEARILPVIELTVHIYTVRQWQVFVSGLEPLYNGQS